jgi:hypothetical protein
MAQEPSQEEDRIFEEEVRRVARSLYQGNEAGGSVTIDGLERDGVFVTEDLVVAIEATRSRGKAKAEKDCGKLRDLVTKLSRKYPDKAVKGLFITSEDPTSEQNAVAGKAGPQIASMSFATFEARLVDVNQYVSARRQYFFGSALDPVTQDGNVQGKYINTEVVKLPEKTQAFSLQKIRQSLDAGAKIVLLGDFGIGKSMALREIFLSYARDRLAGRDQSTMLHLNLRDHQGQTDPVEALERHARLIGFPKPHQLVRAWRSGRATILLDGFDEISAGNWPGRVSSLSDIRRRSVALVRRFMQDTSSSSGVLLAGRSQFFDNEAEMADVLGLTPSSILLSASDLTDAQVKELLASRNWGDVVPEWLPTRPLLVAHLAARGVLNDLKSTEDNLDAAGSWDFLIDQLSKREARIDVGVDGGRVRQILERLATRARVSPSGLGPLSFEDVTSAFQAACGYYPDPESYILLQRLPGMQAYEAESNSRVFIDDDLADSLRAGDVLRSIEDPYNNDAASIFRDAQTALGELGLQLLSYKLASESIEAGSVRTAFQKSVTREGEENVLTLDILRLMLLDGHKVEESLSIQSAYIPSIEFSEGAEAQNISFNDCWIGVLDVGEVRDASKLPQFYRCPIDRVDGVTGIDAFARERFTECTVGNYTDSAENASSILSLSVSDYKRVTISILQRLFLRSGKGRKELAFYRGALSESQKRLVPQALDRLQRERIAWPGRSRGTVLWSPNRAMTSRVRRILSSPTSSTDPVLTED